MRWALHLSLTRLLIREDSKTLADRASYVRSAMSLPHLHQTSPPRKCCLVFYGRPMMTGLRLLAAKRGWTSKQIADTPEGVSELQGLRLSSSGQRFLIVYTTSKAYRHAAIRDLATSKDALVAPIENIHKVTGPKRAQITSIRNYLQSFGFSLEELNFMPRSFVLGEPNDCVQFLKYSVRHPETLWLFKPSSGKGGNGIIIHPDLTFIYKAYASSMQLPDPIVKGDIIAQECISNPLLIDNRKCDIRAYILLAQASPHHLVFYHDGYVRVSIKEYDIDGNRDVHITNGEVQKTVEGFSVDKYYRSFQDLQDYLDKHRPQDGEEFISRKLIPFIQKMGLLIVQAGQCYN